MHISNDIRRSENLHIVFWLIKDTCWMLQLKVLGLTMVAPALFVAVHIMIKSWKENDVFLNAAIVCWITANSYWMIVEFFFEDRGKLLAAIPFGLGFLFVIIFYAKSIRIARRAGNQ